MKIKINKKETVIYITAAMNMCTYKSICSTVIQEMKLTLRDWQM